MHPSVQSYVFYTFQIGFFCCCCCCCYDILKGMDRLLERYLQTNDLAREGRGLLASRRSQIIKTRGNKLKRAQPNENENRQQNSTSDTESWRQRCEREAVDVGVRGFFFFFFLSFFNFSTVRRRPTTSITGLKKKKKKKTTTSGKRALENNGRKEGNDLRDDELTGPEEKHMSCTKRMRQCRRKR